MIPRVRSHEVVVVTPQATGDWAVLICSRSEERRIRRRLVQGYDHAGRKIPPGMRHK